MLMNQDFKTLNVLTLWTLVFMPRRLNYRSSIKRKLGCRQPLFYCPWIECLKELQSGTFYTSRDFPSQVSFILTRTVRLVLCVTHSKGNEEDNWINKTCVSDFDVVWSSSQQQKCGDKTEKPHRETFRFRFWFRFYGLTTSWIRFSLI